MTRKTFPAAPAALGALALLSACSGSDRDAAPPADNGVEMLDVTNEAANVMEAPSPTPAPTAAPDPVVEADPVPRAEQVQEDADATGMTARVARDDAEQNAAQPAEAGEEKR